MFFSQGKSYGYVKLYIFFQVQPLSHVKSHAFKPPLNALFSFLHPNPSTKKSTAGRELCKQCRVLQEVVKQARAESLLRDFFWVALYTGPDVICRALIKDLHPVFIQKRGCALTNTEHPKFSSPHRKVQKRWESPNNTFLFNY